MKIEFSARLKAGIQQVSSDCASDALEGFDAEETGCSEAALLAETALDASRLTTWGYPDADEEVRKLVDAHGYGAVLKEAEKHVCY